MLNISTIFKTFDTSSTSIKDKTGIFNKSYTNIGRDLSSGQGFGTALFSGSHVTKADIANIQAMDTAMKNGSTTAQAWRQHMTGCTVAAKQQAKQCLLNKGSLSELSAGLQSTTLGAKAATLGLKALSIAGNMLLSMGISVAISATIKGIDYLIHRQEKLKEALDESVSALESTTLEIEELEKQSETCAEKIAELQKLKNAGIISIADEKELENLKKENDELERQIVLLKDKQIREGKETLKKTKKTGR